MKRYFFALLLLPGLSCAQTGQTNKKGFEVTGKITGLPDSAEVKLINNNSKVELVKTKAAKGQFILKGSVPEAELYSLSFGKAALTPDGQQQTFYLFLDNSKITITGDIKKMDKFKVTGSPSHNDFVLFQKRFDPLFKEINTRANEINTLPPSLKRDSLLAVYNSTRDKIGKEIEKFVKEKPHSMVTPFMMFVTVQLNEDPVWLNDLFNQLDSNVMKSHTGVSLRQYIDANLVGSVGSKAVDFTQPDTSGVPVSLSSFRGKYVLVDFWASWCGPCRMENPNVVANYKNFNKKNFTVLSVSLDRPGQKDRWIDAIKNDSLTWTHVSDLQFWNNAAAQLYRIQSIPQNMLIDPQGKIVAKNLRGSALHDKLCEIFGCN